ncbi:methionyl-tRNA formyltransferase [Tianweitania sp. BSSL-BM11]|uniref:Methionyl-tRNA formyltransferase n=1 Tax=Tianweitania aestuarii TaxID=2814886 RepID=A0ABS5RSU9_9HYPH|nr:methionyl-tRNA formyltransferase [Tianweitania aestuarii]MBS9720130.1 methionyl-tRNA formyltransferase [Tianweitania aestuarii]
MTLLMRQLFTYELDGHKLMQINTVGRTSRNMPGKVSQSIQLDEEGAAELFAELKSHFGFR